jgi:hypothetical protein
MPTAVDVLDEAIGEASQARTLVSRVRARQVRGVDDRAILKTAAYAWFRDYRAVVETQFPNIDLSEIDRQYRILLDSTTRHAAKKTYLDALKAVKSSLIEVRSTTLIAPPPSKNLGIEDTAPDFSPLISTPEMQEVLTRRWDECRKCVVAEAHLAAIVMMGGLLEALFVARANKMQDKGPLIRAASAPKDKITGKTLNYQEWMLDSYIKVGHELKWITDSARQVADILKEFRNYVHPTKELRHGIRLEVSDSAMFWTVTKTLVRQLLLNAANP